MSTSWTEPQIAFLSNNQHLTDAKIAAEVSKLGPERTSEGVRRKRKLLNAGRPVHQIVKKEPPRLVGYCPKQDDAYVRLLVQESLSLGLLKVAA